MKAYPLEDMALEIIAFKILEHLENQPAAQDTMEGIMQWWLLHLDIKYQSTQVAKVLKDLAAKDVLLEKRDLGALTYRLNPDKREEISSLIKLLKPRSS